MLFREKRYRDPRDDETRQYSREVDVARDSKDPQELDALASSTKFEFVLHSVLVNPHTSEETLAKFAKSKDPEVRAIIARKTKSLETLKRLSKDKDFTVRENIILDLNDAASPELLAEMYKREKRKPKLTEKAKENWRNFKWQIANREKLPREHLLQLAKDADSGVSWNAKKTLEKKDKADKEKIK